jgi:solute carrier family 25 folate transporter 32
MTGTSGNGGSGGLRSVSGALAAVRTVKYEHLVAGVSGGVISTLILHPLDLLKIRFAVDDGQTSRPQYTGLRHACRSIFKQEGVKGFYKGVTPNVAGAGTAWGFYFLFYNTIKTEMQEGNSKTQLSPSMTMLAAAQAGALTLAMTNPIWVVKTRLCLQYDQVPAAKSDPSKTYKGMMDAFYKIGRHEGMRGLYKGFVPGLWGVSHGAIQFMAYEEMKAKYNTFYEQPIDSKLSTVEYLSFAAISKLFAAVTTYPYQVIRARLQDAHSAHTSAVACVRDTLRNEGFLAFYKGLLPNLMRVVPATGITFVVYEKVRIYMQENNL